MVPFFVQGSTRAKKKKQQIVKMLCSPFRTFCVVHSVKYWGRTLPMLPKRAQRNGRVTNEEITTKDRKLKKSCQTLPLGQNTHQITAKESTSQKEKKRFVNKENEECFFDHLHQILATINRKAIFVNNDGFWKVPTFLWEHLYHSAACWLCWKQERKENFERPKPDKKHIPSTLNQKNWQSLFSWVTN